ncbi:MAG: hypothetical protein ACRDC4_00815 [Plesiomonas sp.]
MKEVYVVFKHEMYGYDHENKEVVLVTTDWEKAKAKEDEIDNHRSRQWASITTEELVE